MKRTTKTRMRSSFCADEVSASPAPSFAALRAVRFGALGRRKPCATECASLGSWGVPEPQDEPEDQDAGDLPSGVDEDELEHEELDTDKVTSPEA